jgi:hypothetical protein
MLHQVARDYDDIAEDLEGGAIEVRRIDASTTLMVEAR